MTEETVVAAEETVVAAVETVVVAVEVGVEATATVEVAVVSVDEETDSDLISSRGYWLPTLAIALLGMSVTGIGFFDWLVSTHGDRHSAETN